MKSPTEEDAPMDGYTFHTRNETAEMLDSTPRQVERWVAQGRLGYVRLGNRTLHTPEQIEAFVAASTVQAVS